MRTMRAPIAVPEPDDEPPVICSRIPRIARGRKRQVEAWAADGELVRRELAQQHAAGLAQPRGGDAVLLRHDVQTQLGMAGRADAGRVVDVLQRVGDAVERPAVAPRFQFIVGAASIFQGAILGHQNEGVQCAVARGDAGQRIARKRLGGDGAGPQQAAHFGDGEILRVHHLLSRRQAEHVGWFRLGSVAAVQQCDLARADRHRRRAPRHGACGGTVTPARAIRQSNSAASASGDGVSAMSGPLRLDCRRLCTRRAGRLHSAPKEARDAHAGWHCRRGPSRAAVVASAASAGHRIRSCWRRDRATTSRTASAPACWNTAPSSC